MRGIWKHPKSDNWIARYRGANGKWVNRSTGTTDAEKAEHQSAQWKLDAEKERAEKTGDVSHAGISDTVAKAERLARSGRLDANAAREIVNSLLAAAGHERIDATTNRVLCDTWNASKAGSVKDRSKWKYEQVSRDWLDFLGPKADKPLEIVAKGDAVAHRDALDKTGLSARTVNQAVKLLRGIYADAVVQGHLGRNPFAGVAKLLEDTDTEDTKRVPFSQEDVAALIEAAEGDWKGLVILAASSGLRLMDGARLLWKNLDLDAGTITVKTGKTGVKLTLPIHPALSKWLAEQPRGIGAAPVFPTLATKGGPGKSGLSMAFKTIMKRAGISAGVAREAKGRGRTTSSKSFHSLRHFAVTQLATNGVRADVARSITGHADAATHGNYVNADLAALRGAVDAIRLTA